MGIPAWHVTLCLCAAREFHTSQSSYTLLKWPPGQERQEEKFRLEPYSLCLHRLALWKGHSLGISKRGVPPLAKLPSS